MLNELITVGTSVKALKELLKATLDAKTYEAVNTVLAKATNEQIAAQNLILKLQSEHSTIMREKSLLEQEHAKIEKEIARLLEWRAQDTHYMLCEVAPGAFAYVVKPIDPHVTPPLCMNAWLCCQCYQAGNQSILQFSQWQTHGYREFICPRCQSRLSVHTPSETPYQTSGTKRQSFQNY